MGHDRGEGEVRGVQAIRLRRCAAAPLHHCAPATLRPCAPVPLRRRRCGDAALRRCAAAPLHRQQCGGTAVRRCGGAAVRRCGGAAVRRCGGAAANQGHHFRPIRETEHRPTPQRMNLETWGVRPRHALIMMGYVSPRLRGVPEVLDPGFIDLRNLTNADWACQNIELA